MLKYLDQEGIEKVKTQIVVIVGHYKPEKFGVSYLKLNLGNVSEATIIEALEVLVDDGKITQREFGLSDEPLYHVLV